MTALPWAGLSVIKRGVTSVTVLTVQCSAGDVSPLQQTSSPPSLLALILRFVNILLSETSPVCTQRTDTDHWQDSAANVTVE